MSNSKAWAIDAQFDPTPLLFGPNGQLLGFHAYIGNGYVPRMWCVMTSKSKAHYDNVFHAVKTIGLRQSEGGFHPETAQFDHPRK